MSADRAALAAAVLAVTLAITLIVYAYDTRPQAVNPVETAVTVEVTRVEYRFWPTAESRRPPRPTSTPLRFVRTAIVRTEEAAVLRTATAIIGRSPTKASAADEGGQGT